MKCKVCNVETEQFSDRFADPVCLNCDEIFLAHDKISKKLRGEYYKNHSACPKCGAIEHSTTLAGYIFDSSAPEDFKDLNHCECTKCGDNHTCHERVKEKI